MTNKEWLDRHEMTAEAMAVELTRIQASELNKDMVRSILETKHADTELETRLGVVALMQELGTRVSPIDADTPIVLDDVDNTLALVYICQGKCRVQAEEHGLVYLNTRNGVRERMDMHGHYAIFLANDNGVSFEPMHETAETLVFDTNDNGNSIGFTTAVPAASVALRYKTETGDIDTITAALIDMKCLHGLVLKKEEKEMVSYLYPVHRGD